MTRQAWAAFFLIVGILVTPLWATVRIIGPAPFLLIVVLLVAVRSFPSGDEPAEPKAELPRLSAGNIAIGAAVIAPAAVHLLLIWNDEFPFVGDYDYHLMQAVVSFAFWKTAFLPVIALIAFLFVLLRRNPRSWAALVILVAIVMLGFVQTEPLGFAARYPGGFYFVLVPVKAMAQAMEWSRPLNALRLANFLSVPVWLFVLRPLVLRRWPDVPSLLFGMYFYWQKDVIYYTTAAYLEPWALVLIALAAETMVRGLDVWRAYFMIGAAALFKEQSILILPFVAAAAWPVRGPRESKTAHLLLLLCAAAPFVLYYLLRKASGVWRTAGLASLSEIADPSRLAVFAGRVWLQFDVSLVIVGACLALTLFAMTRPGRGRVYAALLGAALFQVAFFYTDRISVDWTGYPRFQLMPALLLGAVLLEDSFLWGGRKKAVVALMALFIGLLNAAVFVPALRAAAGPEVRRNFVEHYDSPVYFPVRRLFEIASGSGALQGVTRARVFTNIDEVAPRYSPAAIGLAYPGLRNALALSVAQPRLQTPDLCACRSESEVPVALFVHFANLGAEHSNRGRALARQRACTEIMRRTCARIIEVRERDQVVGALGTARSGARPRGGT